MMNVLLRKIRPVEAAEKVAVEEAEEYNGEYSFAIEYKGPVVGLGYEIPQVVPVDVEQIPTAAAVVSGELLKDFSVPVVQPVLKRVNASKMFFAELNFADSLLVEDQCPVSSFEGEEEDMEDGDLIHRDRRKRTLEREGICELGSENGDSGVLERVTIKEVDVLKWSGRSGSSDPIVFSEGSLYSRGVSVSSDTMELELPVESRIDMVIEGYPERLSRSSQGGSFSRSISLETYSHEEEEGEEDQLEDEPVHVRKPSVTFEDGDPTGIEIECDESDSEDVESDEGKRIPVAERKGKKGSCYRCCKGNKFTEKEACFVCGAKFCGKCVLKVMGDMSEGRKCITCITYHIDESRRGKLGKPSRLLKHLLTASQVKQIMSSELTSPANQLIPKLVCVNGKPLSSEEISILRSCKYPPKGLKPGDYWYDKVSGWWGKEGEKPSQIISPQLNVGDPLKRTASNGKTQVLINNRVITKSELMMLRMAGLECEGNPHFWVSEDGSYQEEGQNHVKGKIWDKAGMKLVCAFLSLPVPISISNTGGEDVDHLPNGAVLDQVKKKDLYKLLLVGFNNSGTSTIHKQAKILYNVPFSEDERQTFKSLIQCNLYKYLAILLEGRQKFEEESIIEERRKLTRCGPSGEIEECEVKTIYTLGLQLKGISDWIVSVMLAGDLEAIFPASTREYAQYVEKLWKNSAIQATYERRREIEKLPRAASYFLERADEIAMVDYEPSNTDILYAEGMISSNGVTSMEFSFPMSAGDGCLEPPYRNDLMSRYQLIRLHPRALGEHCKWVEMFEDVDLVIYCVSLTDYCQVCDDGTNKMLASKKLFESMITNPTLAAKQFLLILNKFDLLEETIEDSPLTQCDWFSDFNPVISKNNKSKAAVYTNPSLAQRAFNYIAVKFKRLYEANVNSDRKLYVSLVNGLEPKNVDDALRYARHTLKWQEDKPSFTNNENSSYSMEASSSS